jgi:hypothetical protein
MQFDHIQVPGNPLLKASFCSVCGTFVAASPNRELLILVELRHICAEADCSIPRSSDGY